MNKLSKTFCLLFPSAALATGPTYAPWPLVVGLIFLVYSPYIASTIHIAISKHIENRTERIAWIAAIAATATGMTYFINALNISDSGTLLIMPGAIIWLTFFYKRIFLPKHVAEGNDPGHADKLTITMPSKIAGYAAITFALYILLNPLIRNLNGTLSVDIGSILTQPSYWLRVVTCCVVGWGLIRQERWSWWLGLILAGFALFKNAATLLSMTRHGFSPPFAFIMTNSFLVIFLIILLDIRTRKACGLETGVRS